MEWSEEWAIHNKRASKASRRQRGNKRKRELNWSRYKVASLQPTHHWLFLWSSLLNSSLCYIWITDVHIMRFISVHEFSLKKQQSNWSTLSSPSFLKPKNKIESNNFLRVVVAADRLFKLVGSHCYAMISEPPILDNAKYATHNNFCCSFFPLFSIVNDSRLFRFARYLKRRPFNFLFLSW